MIERLLDWWYERRIRAHHQHRAAQPAAPLRFPLTLATTISSVRAEVELHYGTDEAMDNALPISGRTDRIRTYMLNNPGGACVNVAYSYSETDGAVWSIRVDNAAPSFSGEVGAVPLTSDASALSTILGAPRWENQQAPLIKASLWLLPDSGYRIEMYSETYDDIGGHHRFGEIQSIEWFSRELAPPQYEILIQDT